MQFPDAETSSKGNPFCDSTHGWAGLSAMLRLMVRLYGFGIQLKSLCERAVRSQSLMTPEWWVSVHAQT